MKQLQNKDFSVKGHFRYNTLAEIYILSSLLNFPYLILQSTQLTEDDFFSHENKIIFQQIKKVFEQNNTVFPSLVMENLKSSVTLISYVERLNEISNSSVGKENFEFFLNIVLDCSKRRKIAKLGKELIELSSFNCVEELTERAEKVFLDLHKSSFHSNSKLTTGSDSSDLDNIFDKILNSDGYSEEGLRTNFSDLDHIFNGFFPSEVTVIASRTAMGKTSFATSLVLNLSKYQKKKVLFFSLEMSRFHILSRIISSLSHVSLTKILKKNIDSKEKEEIVKSRDVINKFKLTICDAPNLTVSDIKSISRQEYMKEKIDVIFIDYIQLISSKKKSENRTYELGYITKEIKNLARELNIPIVVLSQLSRSTEMSEDKRPNIWNIKSSGAIEEHFDNIILIYRKNYYTFQQNNECKFSRENKSPSSMVTEEKNSIISNSTSVAIDSKNNHITEITVAKQRNGSTGRINLLFKSLYSSFIDSIEE